LKRSLQCSVEGFNRKPLFEGSDDDLSAVEDVGIIYPFVTHHSTFFRTHRLLDQITMLSATLCLAAAVALPANRHHELGTVVLMPSATSEVAALVDPRAIPFALSAVKIDQKSLFGVSLPNHRVRARAHSLSIPTPTSPTCTPTCACANCRHLLLAQPAEREVRLSIFFLSAGACPTRPSPFSTLTFLRYLD
jgi:hypothetical protein